MLTPPTTRRDRVTATVQQLLRHDLAVPVLMAVMIVAMGAHVACTFKLASWGNDEPAHFGYIVSLANGVLPTIDSPIMADPGQFGDLAGALTGWDGDHNDIWVANHAPLFHLLLVPIWWLGQSDLETTFVVMRLVNTVGFGAWVIATALVVRELVPRRPAVVALASVITVAPTLALRSGFLQNDGWGSAAAVVVVLMTIRMMRGGPTRRQLVIAAVAGIVAAGTRAPGVLAVAVCALVLLAYWWRSGERRTALLGLVVVGGVPALAVSWFYLRNLSLYGGVTASSALLEKFDRVPRTSLVDLWNAPGFDSAVLATPISLLALLTLGPLVAVRWARGRHAFDAAWVLVIAQGLLTGLNFVQFVSTGGGFHDRYLMPIMPLLAAVTALGMLELGRRAGQAVDPRREWRAAAAWGTVLLLWLAGAFVVLEIYYVFSRQDTFPITGPLLVLLPLVWIAAAGATITVLARRALHVVPVAVPDVAADPEPGGTAGATAAA